jgi:VPDSG-CTERM motif
MTTKNCRHLPKGFALVSLIFCLGGWSRANATVISIDLGPSPNITNHVGAMFRDLNGTSLDGQSLSLDFLFSNGKFARLFSVTNPQFAILVTLNTTGSGNVGVLDGTGFLLDKNGSALGSPQDLGSASGSDGSLSVALFPLLSNQFSTPLDFFGVHMDWMLPINSSVSINGGKFELVAAGAGDRDVFGIGPGVPRDIVPDSGSTLLLLSLALFGVQSICRRIPATHNVP